MKAWIFVSFSVSRNGKTDFGDIQVETDVPAMHPMIMMTPRHLMVLRAQIAERLKSEGHKVPHITIHWWQIMAPDQDAEGANTPKLS